jgi:hypothetical protein
MNNKKIFKERAEKLFNKFFMPNGTEGKRYTSPTACRDYAIIVVDEVLEVISDTDSIIYWKAVRKELENNTFGQSWL